MSVDTFSLDSKIINSGNNVEAKGLLPILKMPINASLTFSHREGTDGEDEHGGSLSTDNTSRFIPAHVFAKLFKKQILVINQSHKY